MESFILSPHNQTDLISFILPRNGILTSDQLDNLLDKPCQSL